MRNGRVGSMVQIAVASAEQQRSESPANTQSQKLENPDTTKEMTSKDGIGPKMMIKGGGKGGWLKAPLSEAQEPHGEWAVDQKVLLTDESYLYTLDFPW